MNIFYKAQNLKFLDIYFGIFFALGICNPAHAEKLLRVYGCPSEKNALLCDSSCKKGITQVSFAASPNSKTVLMNVFRDRERLRSVSLPGCSVVDRDNWICENHEAIGSEAYFDKWIMSGGSFSSIQYGSVHSGGKTFSCAK